jgi:hypothetical protein
VQRTEVGLWAVKRLKKSTKWVHNLRPHRSYEDLVFHYPVPSKKKDRLRHKSKKPDDLFREIIQIFSNPGDLVLDPFAGGGTTAYAAEAEGRRHISFELDKQWAEETTRHWQRGKEAKPLVFPTTPAEKAEAAYKHYLALCKKLGVDPTTGESVVTDSSDITHQDAGYDGDVVVVTKLAPTSAQDYKHTVRLKGI